MLLKLTLEAVDRHCPTLFDALMLLQAIAFKIIEQKKELRALPASVALARSPWPSNLRLAPSRVW